MTGTRTTLTTGPVAGLLLILAVLFIAAGCGAVANVLPSPSATPVPTAESPTAGPTVGPTSNPTEPPTAVPSATPAEGEGVRLDVADPHDVVVEIADPDGLLAGAGSGRAGDGMSVRWGDVQVVNVDADTLRVTWAGLPVDARIALDVAATADGYALRFTQPAPPANSDAIGFDRVLVLDFAAPVQADEVAVAFTAA